VVLAPSSQDQVTTWLAMVKEGVVTPNEMRASVLRLPPLEQGEALDELVEPPTAAASPSDEMASPVVQELRPSMLSTVNA
jgi:hypothetical protein